MSEDRYVFTFDFGPFVRAIQTMAEDIALWGKIYGNVIPKPQRRDAYRLALPLWCLTTQADYLRYLRDRGYFDTVNPSNTLGASEVSKSPSGADIMARLRSDSTWLPAPGQELKPGRTYRVTIGSDGLAYYREMLND